MKYDPRDPSRIAPPDRPQLVDGPCGRIIIDGVDWGTFREPCAEVEEILFRALGRRIQLPRPKIDPRDRGWPLDPHEVLTVNSGRAKPRPRVRGATAVKKPSRSWA